MKSPEQARELARTMVELGRAHNVKTVALLTDMNTPLGLAIGNAVEVEESVQGRAGGGDPEAPLPSAKETELLRAKASGVVQSVDALALGTAAWRLGAGRGRK